MRNLSLAMMVLLFAQVSNAQKIDSLKRLYMNQGIYRYGDVYMKGAERLSFRQLQSEFSFSPIGLDSYNLGKSYRASSTVFRLLSFACIMAAGSFAANNNKKATYGSLAGQVVLGVISMRYDTLSAQQTDKALWQRNKDLLFFRDE